MHRSLRRGFAVLFTVSTLLLGVMVVASSSAAGVGLLRTIGNNHITHVMAGLRPMVEARAAGGGFTSGTFQAQISIGSNGTVTSKGLLITVPITLACTDPGQVSFQVSQNAGHAIAQAFGEVSSSSNMPTLCDGLTRTFQATAQAQNIPFKAGSALVRVTYFPFCFYVCGPATTAQATVRLHRA
jgi:hypothetical protein